MLFTPQREFITTFFESAPSRPCRTERAVIKYTDLSICCFLCAVCEVKDAADDSDVNEKDDFDGNKIGIQWLAD